MKYLPNILSGALLLAAVVSCVDNAENPDAAPVFHRYLLSFEPESKTVLSSNGGASRQVNWSYGDEILYYNENTQSGFESAIVSIDNGIGSIDIITNPDCLYINAIYGAESILTNLSRSNYMVAETSVKSVQTHTTFSEAHVCAAFCEDPRSETLHFKNVASMFMFTSNAGVDKVVLRGNNQEAICGGPSGKLWISDISGALVVTPHQSETGDKTTITVEGCNQDKVFYVSILPVYFPDGITLECYSAGKLLFSRRIDRGIDAGAVSGKPKIINLGRVENWQETIPDPVIESALLMDFSSPGINYSCETDSLCCSWDDISSVYFEGCFGLGVQDVKSGFIPESDDPSDFTLIPYTLKSGKSGNALDDFQRCPRFSDGVFKYGTLRYYPEGSPYNGANFVITLDKAQKDMLWSIGRSVELYARFSSYSHDIFLGFIVHINPMTAIRFFEHNPRYWYWDVDNNNASTIRMTTPVPMVWKRGYNANTDVTEMVHLLTDDWTGRRIQSNPGLDPDNTMLEWTFNTSNKNIRIPDPDNLSISRQWKINRPSGQAIEYLSYGTNPDPVVILNKNTGEVTYVYDDSPDYISKKLLNLHSPDETDPAKMLYCKIDLTAWAIKKNDRGLIVCSIQLGSESLYARFIQPVRFLINGDISLRDGIPGVTSINLGNLFSAYDWNHVEYDTGYPLFKFDQDTQTTRPCFYPDGGDEIEWYGYYGISRISVDLDNVQVTQPGSSYAYGKLSEYCPSARIWVANKSDKYTPVSATDIDISMAENLGNYILVYSNSNGGLYGYALSIPVTIEYAWGSVSLSINCTLN